MTIKDLDKKVADLQAQWVAAGPPLKQSPKRSDIATRLGRGQNNRAVVAALALALEGFRPYMGHEFVGYMTAVEESKTKRKRGAR